MNQPPNIPSPRHEFRYSGADLVRVRLPSLAGFAAIVLLLHAFNNLSWLLDPILVEGTERALIQRRMLMAKSVDPAAILIVGDSSSAISAQATLLSDLLPSRPAVLNQELFMFFSIATYADATTQFIDLPGTGQDGCHGRHDAKTAIVANRRIRLQPTDEISRQQSFTEPPKP